MLIIALCATTMINTGCFGSFGLTTGLWGWNKSVSGNKFVQWLIFLLLVIIPIYGIATFVDALVINSIEFWTGSNPMADADSEERNRYVQLDEEHTLHLFRADELNMQMTIIKNGQVDQEFMLTMVEDGMELRDGNGVLLGRVDEMKEAIQIINGAGEPLAVYDAAEGAALLRAYEQGGATFATDYAMKRYVVDTNAAAAAR